MSYIEEMINKCQYLKDNGINIYTPSTAYNMADFSQIYSFTTENIAGYIQEFKLKNKSLMTVGSSGDQLINAILFGCQDITNFDICPYSKYYIFLKLASILALSQEDFNFLDYFIPMYHCLPNNNCSTMNFDWNIYKKVRSTLRALDFETFQVWEDLFDNFEPSIIKQALFSPDVSISKKNISRVNHYLLNSTLYEKTKAKIKKAHVNFLTGDIITANFDQQFDNIWLSNIEQYLSILNSERMINNMKNHLTSNGKLLICYIYNSFIPAVSKGEEYCPEHLQQFVTDIIQIQCFSQKLYAKNPSATDEVLIYRKNN